MPSHSAISFLFPLQLGGTITSGSEKGQPWFPFPASEGGTLPWVWETSSASKGNHPFIPWLTGTSDFLPVGQPTHSDFYCDQKQTKNAKTFVSSSKTATTSSYHGDQSCLGASTQRAYSLLWNTGQSLNLGVSASVFASEKHWSRAGRILVLARQSPAQFCHTETVASIGVLH